LPAGTSLFGPFTGRLANEGETIRLEQPDTPQLPPHPDAGFVPYVLLDHIATALPCPGRSAPARFVAPTRQPANYGNELTGARRPAWRTTIPLPGTDADGDGLPDDWGTGSGSIRTLPAVMTARAAVRTATGSNLREFQTGQSPREFSRDPPGPPRWTAPPHLLTPRADTVTASGSSRLHGLLKPTNLLPPQTGGSSSPCLAPASKPGSIVSSCRSERLSASGLRRLP
jgi:hypothetical protein